MSEKPVRKLTSDINCAIHNKFEFEVLDAETKEVKQRAEAYNVICDTFWTILVEHLTGQRNNAIFSQLIVGSGTGTPASTDTVLFNKIKNYSSWSNFDGAFMWGNTLALDYSTPGVVIGKRRIVIQADDLVGEDLKEIGLSYDGTNIVTHAMLQDMNGNPLSIHKTEHDIINIYALIYIHFNNNGYSGIYVVSPSDQLGISRMSGNYGRPSNFIENILGNGSLKDSNQTYYYGACKLDGSLSDGMSWYGSDSAAIYDVDIQNKRFSIKKVRFDQTKGNHPIPYITYVAHSDSSQLFPDLLLTHNIIPRSQLEITEEAIGTGDGNSLDFSTKFPINSDMRIYIDGVLINSGYSLVYGGERLTTSSTNLIVSGNFMKKNQGRVISNAYHYARAMNTFYPPQPDSVIYENPNQWYFNSIAYTFEVGDLNFGVTLYVEHSSDGNSWNLLETRTPTQTGRMTYTLQLSSLLNSPYIRFRWDMQNAPESWGYIQENPSVNFWNAIFYNDTYGPCNIHFDTPPAAGAVITADYLPDCIPKDEDHVLDIGLTIQFGAYTGSGV